MVKYLEISKFNIVAEYIYILSVCTIFPFLLIFYERFFCLVTEKFFQFYIKVIALNKNAVNFIKYME